MDNLESNPVVDVPQVARPPSAQADALDAVLLDVRLEELERRLRARSSELETELKAKERLRERVRELTSRVEELQETASVLHREAASSTSLAREFDETLKVAAEARAQLGAALGAERNRRFEVEADLERLTEERSALLLRVESLDRDGQAALEAAEQVRREGVEAFEKAHEAQIRQEMEGERVQKELVAGMQRVAVESEQLRAKAEQLKQELRARSDREVAEMRRVLDEERARLYADIEAEREARGKRATPVPAEDPAKSSHEAGEARRREIVKEVESYLAALPQTPLVVPAPAPAVSVVEPASKIEPPAPVPQPSLFRWDEEMRLLLYVAISVSLVAAVVAGAVLYQG